MAVPELRSTSAVLDFITRAWPSKVLVQEKKAVLYLEEQIAGGSTCQSKVSQNPNFVPFVFGPDIIFDPALAYSLLHDIPTVSEVVKGKLLQVIHEHKGFPFSGYFVDDTILPFDVDTSSVLLWTRICSGTINLKDKKDLGLATAIAKYVSLNLDPKTGVIETYFPPHGPRQGKLDPGIVANVLRIFYLLGMDQEAQRQELYLMDWLEHGLDQEPRNYTSHIALFFTSNLFSVSRTPKLHLLGLVKKRLVQNLGSSDNCLGAAMRILTAYNIGLFDPQNASKTENEDLVKRISEEVDLLERMQSQNGSWEAAPLYKAGGMQFGSEEMTTCFALRALYLARKSLPRTAPEGLEFYKVVKDSF